MSIRDLRDKIAAIVEPMGHNADPFEIADEILAALRDSDTRRKGETTKIGSVRSTGSAGLKGIAQ